MKRRSAWLLRLLPGVQVVEPRGALLGELPRDVSRSR